MSNSKKIQQIHFQKMLLETLRCVYFRINIDIFIIRWFIKATFVFHFIEEKFPSLLWRGAFYFAKPTSLAWVTSWLILQPLCTQKSCIPRAERKKGHLPYSLGSILEASCKLLCLWMFIWNLEVICWIRLLLYVLSCFYLDVCLWLWLDIVFVLFFPSERMHSLNH